MVEINHNCCPKLDSYLGTNILNKKMWLKSAIIRSLPEYIHGTKNDINTTTI